MCKQVKPLRALAAPSEEADNLCLLCEAEAICPDCQKIKHPPQGVE